QGGHRPEGKDEEPQHAPDALAAKQEQQGDPADHSGDRIEGGRHRPEGERGEDRKGGGARERGRSREARAEETQPERKENDEGMPPGLGAKEDEVRIPAAPRRGEKAGLPPEKLPGEEEEREERSDPRQAGGRADRGGMRAEDPGRCLGQDAVEDVVGRQR